MESLPSVTSQRKMFNATAFTCLMSVTAFGGTFINSTKDYGTPPSKYLEYQDQQMSDVNVVLRGALGALTLVSGVLALSLRNKRRQSPEA